MITMRSGGTPRSYGIVVDEFSLQDDKNESMSFRPARLKATYTLDPAEMHDGGGWFMEPGSITFEWELWTDAPDGSQGRREWAFKTEFMLPWDEDGLIAGEDTEAVPWATAEATIAEKIREWSGGEPKDYGFKAVKNLIAKIAEDARVYRIQAMVKDTIRIGTYEEVAEALRDAAVSEVIEG